MRKALVVIAGVVALAVVDYGIAQRESLLRDGRIVLLELAPVDPRSLMQGDYMALRFKAAGDAFGGKSGHPADGFLVVQVGAESVATFRRFDDGSPLAQDEARLRYRVRNMVPRLATNAYFFEEGRAKDYEAARYGEFRVATNGDAILTHLRDADRKLLGASATR